MNNKTINKIKSNSSSVIHLNNKLQRINERESCFFEKINKIDRPLANLTKMRREKTQISKITIEKGEITINTMEIQDIIRDYFEKVYSIKFENLEKMDRFIDIYDHPKLKHGDINYLNRSITLNEIEQK
jgi:hypothetical protein